MNGDLHEAACGGSERQDLAGGAVADQRRRGERRRGPAHSRSRAATGRSGARGVAASRKLSGRRRGSWPPSSPRCSRWGSGAVTPCRTAARAPAAGGLRLEPWTVACARDLGERGVGWWRLWGCCRVGGLVRGTGVGVWYGVLCWAGGLLRVSVMRFHRLGCSETYLG